MKVFRNLRAFYFSINRYTARRREIGIERLISRCQVWSRAFPSSRTPIAWAPRASVYTRRRFYARVILVRARAGESRFSADRPFQIVWPARVKRAVLTAGVYISAELEVAQARLSDLRALDTLRGNKCALLRFHGRRYVVPGDSLPFRIIFAVVVTPTPRYQRNF